MLVGARGYEDDEGAVYIYSGPDDAAGVIPSRSIGRAPDDRGG